MVKSPFPSKRLLVLMTFLFVLLAGPRHILAQSKSFFWEQYDVDITLLENGELQVLETQTLNFSGAPFTFGFRGIPVGSNGNNDGITDIFVREGDLVYSRSGSQQAGTFKVERESGEEVITWYFEPAVGRRTYQIGYTVLGGVRLGTSEAGSGDQIFWKPLPTDLLARIDRSTITIHLPEGIRPQQFSETSDYLVAAYINNNEAAGVDIETSEDARTITYRTSRPLIPGEVLEVRVQFPHGPLSIETPDWQSREQRGDVASLFVVVISLLIAIGGPLMVLLLWYTKGRDPQLGIVVPEYVSEPPSDLPPALVGALVDEKADMRDIVSTLIDLARRGYMIISEEKRDHSFKRTDKPDTDLRPFERQFLRDLFRGREERSLKSLRYKFAEKLPKLRKMLYEELRNEGLVPRSPESVRNSYGCFSIVIIAGAIATFVGLQAIMGDVVATAICPALALGLTGAVLLVTSRFMPVKTGKGAEAAAKWEAFKEYLRNAERYGNLEEATGIFENYLAYATAFGLERTWVRKFAQIPSTPIPPWYGPYLGPGHYGHRGMRGVRRPGESSQAPSLEGTSRSLTGGLESMSSGLTRMLNSASTVLKSTPPSSSGSSGGFSGGFSGGSSGGGGSAGFG